MVAAVVHGFQDAGDSAENDWQANPAGLPSIAVTTTLVQKMSEDVPERSGVDRVGGVQDEPADNGRARMLDQGEFLEVLTVTKL